MPVSPSQLRQNIDPGSIPFGQRQTLESRLPEAASRLGLPSNPLDPLAGGAIPANPDEEVTAGLSVGPGPGPAAGPPESRADRLRMVALYAQSPVLRDAARRALRAQVRANRVA